MQEALARLVHPILSHGLGLRRRFLRGETPSLVEEQAELAGLLEGGGARLADFHGDPDGGRFLGLRYALTCWLDELFVVDSPWAAEWNESKLEVRLYGGNDRAWRFWEQTQVAASRSTADALEGMLLCVLLGFTGEKLDDPASLAGWVASARLQLGKGGGRAWQPPAGLVPATDVPPLTGRGRLRTMLLVACGVLLALGPAVALLLARRGG